MEYITYTLDFKPIKKKEKIIIKKITTDSKEQQKKINYAWKVSEDPYFIYLLEAENDDWDEKTVSKHYIIRNGKKYHDVGICQMNEYWQKKHVNNPKFKDWKWQIRKCYELYKGGTTFYGKNLIYKTKKRFNIIK